MIITLKPEDIQISIEDNISMEWKDFVADSLSTIREGHDVPGCADATNYLQLIIIIQNANAKCWLVKFIASHPVHAINDTCVCLVKKWTSLAGEAFPSRAKIMNDDELNFAVLVKTVHNQFLLQKWKPLFSSIPFLPLMCLSEKQYLYLFLWLSNDLFFYGPAPWPTMTAVQ